MKTGHTRIGVGLRISNLLSFVLYQSSCNREFKDHHIPSFRRVTPAKTGAESTNRNRCGPRLSPGWRARGLLASSSSFLLDEAGRSRGRRLSCLLSSVLWPGVDFLNPVINLFQSRLLGHSETRFENGKNGRKGKSIPGKKDVTNLFIGTSWKNL